jgi:hypothetical protein
MRRAVVAYCASVLVMLFAKSHADVTERVYRHIYDVAVKELTDDYFEQWLQVHSPGTLWIPHVADVLSRGLAPHFAGYADVCHYHYHQSYNYTEIMSRITFLRFYQWIYESVRDVETHFHESHGVPKTVSITEWISYIPPGLMDPALDDDIDAFIALRRIRLVVRGVLSTARSCPPFPESLESAEAQFSLLKNQGRQTTPGPSPIPEFYDFDRGRIPRYGHGPTRSTPQTQNLPC